LPSNNIRKEIAKLSFTRYYEAKRFSQKYWNNSFRRDTVKWLSQKCCEARVNAKR